MTTTSERIKILRKKMEIAESLGIPLSPRRPAPAPVASESGQETSELAAQRLAGLQGEFVPPETTGQSSPTVDFLSRGVAKGPGRIVEVFGADIPAGVQAVTERMREAVPDALRFDKNTYVGQGLQDIQAESVDALTSKAREVADISKQGMEEAAVQAYEKFQGVRLPFMQGTIGDLKVFNENARAQRDGTAAAVLRGLGEELPGGLLMTMAGGGSAKLLGLSKYAGASVIYGAENALRHAGQQTHELGNFYVGDVLAEGFVAAASQYSGLKLNHLEWFKRSAAAGVTAGITEASGNLIRHEKLSTEQLVTSMILEGVLGGVGKADKRMDVDGRLGAQQAFRESAESVVAKYGLGPEKGQSVIDRTIKVFDDHMNAKEADFNNRLEIELEKEAGMAKQTLSDPAVVAELKKKVALSDNAKATRKKGEVDSKRDISESLDRLHHNKGTDEDFTRVSTWAESEGLLDPARHEVKVRRDIAQKEAELLRQDMERDAFLRRAWEQEQARQAAAQRPRFSPANLLNEIQRDIDTSPMAEMQFDMLRQTELTKGLSDAADAGVAPSMSVLNPEGVDLPPSLGELESLIRVIGPEQTPTSTLEPGAGFAGKPELLPQVLEQRMRGVSPDSRPSLVDATPEILAERRILRRQEAGVVEQNRIRKFEKDVEKRMDDILDKKTKGVAKSEYSKQVQREAELRLEENGVLAKSELSKPPSQRVHPPLRDDFLDVNGRQIEPDALDGNVNLNKKAKSVNSLRDAARSHHSKLADRVGLSGGAIGRKIRSLVMVDQARVAKSITARLKWAARPAQRIMSTGWGIRGQATEVTKALTRLVDVVYSEDVGRLSKGEGSVDSSSNVMYEFMNGRMSKEVILEGVTTKKTKKAVAEALDSIQAFRDLFFKISNEYGLDVLEGSTPRFMTTGAFHREFVGLARLWNSQSPGKMEADVFEAFRQRGSRMTEAEISDAMDALASRRAPRDTESPSLVRKTEFEKTERFDVLPTEFTDSNGKTIRVLEDDPNRLIESWSRMLGERAATNKVIGGEAEIAALREQYIASGGKAQVSYFDELMKAINGIPLTDFTPGTLATLYESVSGGRRLHPTSKAWKANEAVKAYRKILNTLRLSLVAPLQPPETVMAAKAFGWKAFAKGWWNMTSKDRREHVKKIGADSDEFLNAAFSDLLRGENIGDLAQQIGSRATAAHLANRIVNTHGALAAENFAAQLRAGEQSGSLARRTLREMRFSEQENSWLRAGYEKALKMGATPERMSELYRSVEVNGQTFLTGHNYSSSERSALAHSTRFNSLIDFDRFGQHRLGRFGVILNTLEEATTTQQKMDAARSFISEMGFTLGQGLITEAAIELVKGGPSALAAMKEKFVDEPINLMDEDRHLEASLVLASRAGELFFNAMAGPLVTAAGDGIMGLVEFSAPYQLVETLHDAMAALVGAGKFSGLGKKDRWTLLLKSKAPGIEAAQSNLHIAGLNEFYKDHDVAAAERAFWEFNRTTSLTSMTFGTPGPTDLLSYGLETSFDIQKEASLGRAFKNNISMAAKAMSAGNREKAHEYIAKAISLRGPAGKTNADIKTAMLSARRLSSPGFSKSRKDEFRLRRPDSYEVLREHDARIEAWAKHEFENLPPEMPKMPEMPEMPEMPLMIPPGGF